MKMLGFIALFPAPQDDYRLVWSDEFNRTGKPNPNDWDYEIGFVRNRELQSYQPDNASIQHGILIIEGKRQQVPNPHFEAGSKDWRKSQPTADFTSACITTLNKHAWLYGRFEIRARIKAEDGLWPAIWMLGQGKPWPHCGEVDIMEYYRKTVLANSAWGNGTWNTVKTPLTHFTDKDPNWDRKFHVWRMDWTPEFMRISLDGELLNETDLSKTIDPDGSNPFHAPMYMLLNLAIGSTGGDTSKTKFPTKFEVDYVRVYQKPGAQPSN